MWYTLWSAKRGVTCVGTFQIIHAGCVSLSLLFYHGLMPFGLAAIVAAVPHVIVLVSVGINGTLNNSEKPNNSSYSTADEYNQNNS
jgi:hypothetical protein